MKTPDSFDIHQAARQLRSDLLGEWLARTAAAMRAQFGRLTGAPKASLARLRGDREAPCQA